MSKVCCQGGSIMSKETLLDCLYNELINLDEQAGCYDEETNARIDEERRKLAEQIHQLNRELEAD